MVVLAGVLVGWLIAFKGGKLDGFVAMVAGRTRHASMATKSAT